MFAARQLEPPREVAVKVLRVAPTRARDLGRFRTEANALARLGHPAIARIYASGVDRRNGLALPYIVMERIASARSVVEWARAPGRSPHAIALAFAEIGDAMQHGHNRGVIHRDLKPSNILVDGDDRPRVIDFGIARLVSGADEDQTETLAGVLIGTPAYMAPEQFELPGAEIDARVDIHAIGLILYESLLGRRAYDITRERAFDARRIVRETDPPVPHRVDSHIPADLSAIAMKAMAKDRERRYPSMSALAEDLRAFVDGRARSDRHADRTDPSRDGRAHARRLGGRTDRARDRPSHRRGALARRHALGGRRRGRQHRGRRSRWPRTRPREDDAGCVGRRVLAGRNPPVRGRLDGRDRRDRPAHRAAPAERRGRRARHAEARVGRKPHPRDVRHARRRAAARPLVARGALDRRDRRRNRALVGQRRAARPGALARVGGRRPRVRGRWLRRTRRVRSRRRSRARPRRPAVAGGGPAGRPLRRGLARRFDARGRKRRGRDPRGRRAHRRAALQRAGRPRAVVVRLLSRWFAARDRRARRPRARILDRGRHRTRAPRHAVARTRVGRALRARSKHRRRDRVAPRALRRGRPLGDAARLVSAWAAARAHDARLRRPRADPARRRVGWNRLGPRPDAGIVARDPASRARRARRGRVRPGRHAARRVVRFRRRDRLAQDRLA